MALKNGWRNERLLRAAGPLEKMGNHSSDTDWKQQCSTLALPPYCRPPFCYSHCVWGTLYTFSRERECEKKRERGRWESNNKENEQRDGTANSISNNTQNRHQQTKGKGESRTECLASLIRLENFFSFLPLFLPIFYRCLCYWHSLPLISLAASHHQFFSHSRHASQRHSSDDIVVCSRVKQSKAKVKKKEAQWV